MRNSLFALCGLAALHTVGAAAEVVKGKVFDRFITIWLENQDFVKAAVDKNLADLKKQGVLLTRYYAHTHPSQPNYLAAIAGDYFGLNHDKEVRVPENVSTVVDLLDTRGLSWGGYFEDMPGPGFMGNYSDGSTDNGGWDYVRKHNPFVSFDSVTNNGTRLLCLQSFNEFHDDFVAKRVPQFVFMSPNMMHDGHNTSLETATEWSHAFLEPLLDDKAFDERTLILLTFDESENYGKPNHIVSLLLGNAVPKELRGTQDDTFYTHYSILSSVQNNWGLPHLGRYDVGANVFRFAAETARYGGNRDPTNLATLDNSVSYPGFLHDKTWLPIPIPNWRLGGAGGKGALPAVENIWRIEDGVSWNTPYDGSGKVFDGAKNMPIYKPAVAN
ncbi:acid phosphatase [Pseudoneurospora amorphoporcata]|uniref:Acid phosphatase n=1 Tax=Pseudoneurospora amorphoporcata TaxID=241081 RepID=A0AAN6SJF7_9PEZI|nr:acid phosphatase [Pseudoneurospora amorphoporcata]